MRVGCLRWTAWAAARTDRYPMTLGPPRQLPWSMRGDPGNQSRQRAQLRGVKRARAWRPGPVAQTCKRSALYRTTASRSACRSMPASCAASARLEPSSRALEMANIPARHRLVRWAPRQPPKHVGGYVAVDRRGSRTHRILHQGGPEQNPIKPSRADRARHRPRISSTRSRKTELPLRQSALSPGAPHRKHVRPAQGLVPSCHSLRPLRLHLFLGHLHHSHHYVLTDLASPEPRLTHETADCPGFRHAGASATSQHPNKASSRFQERTPSGL